MVFDRHVSVMKGKRFSSRKAEIPIEAAVAITFMYSNERKEKIIHHLWKVST